MNPALIGLVIQFAMQYGIPAARQIIEIVHKPDPTAADWTKVFDLAEDNAKKFLDATKP